MCDLVVSIPTSEKYPAMNISHSCAIILYEIYKKHGENKIGKTINEAVYEYPNMVNWVPKEKMPKTKVPTKTKMTMSRLFQKYPQDIFIIRVREFNQVEIEMFYDPQKPDCKKIDKVKTILFIGEISPRKGILTLINALGELKKTRSDFRLNIVGYGIQEAEAKKLTEELGLSAHVTFCGRKPKNEVVGFMLAKFGNPWVTGIVMAGLFAAGDCVTGATSVVEAIASGQKAAFYINRYLQGDVLRVRPEKASRTGRHQDGNPGGWSKKRRGRSCPCSTRRSGFPVSKKWRWGSAPRLPWRRQRDAST
jgi:glycosyltransferase involved in cell wall biosynthesis